MTAQPSPGWRNPEFSKGTKRRPTKQNPQADKLNLVPPCILVCVCVWRSSQIDSPPPSSGWCSQGPASPPPSLTPWKACWAFPGCCLVFGTERPAHARALAYHSSEVSANVLHGAFAISLRQHKGPVTTEHSELCSKLNGEWSRDRQIT